MIVCKWHPKGTILKITTIMMARQDGVTILPMFPSTFMMGRITDSDLGILGCGAAMVDLVLGDSDTAHSAMADLGTVHSAMVDLGTEAMALQIHGYGAVMGLEASGLATAVTTVPIIDSVMVVSTATQIMPLHLEGGATILIPPQELV